MTIRRRLLVFDFDGTLADTSDDLVISTNHVRHSFDFPPLSRGEVLSMVGRGALKLISSAIAAAPDHPRTRKALAIFEEHYGRHQFDHVSLYPSVRETIEALHATARLAVLSNKPGDMVRRLCRHLGIDPWFDPIWGGDDVPAMKPDPSGLRAIMAMVGAEPEDTVMIGDLDYDIDTGRAAGVKTVLCDFGFRSVDKEHVRADREIRRMADLLGVL